MNKFYWLLSLMLLTPTSNAIVYTWPTPQGARLIGDNYIHTVFQGEHLADIADQYDVGFLSLLSANHDIDPYLLQPNSFLTIPKKLILPDVPYQGIVINLAELRLYYFDEKNKRVHVFPIGIGRIGRETPLMTTHISQKRTDPEWVPTEEIKREYKQERGIVLPNIVPPGDDNPLGEHALRLAFEGGVYSIHGTNKDFGVGLRVSAGCIRLAPQNISWLFKQVKVGEKVRIINQAVKTSLEPDGTFYVEAHRPLSRDIEEAESRILTQPDPSVLKKLEGNKNAIDRYLSVLAIQSGLPTEITSLFFKSDG